MDRKRRDNGEITPVSKSREWKLLYYEPGRPGLEEGSEYRGLCGHCALRETCALPRPEGGVWRCENYIAMSKEVSLYENVVRQLEEAVDVVHFDRDICKILAATMKGGGGIVSTTLADNITASSEFIPATNTTLFASRDILLLGDEEILYSSLNSTGFIAQTRGYDGTDADDHIIGERIYTQEAGVLNAAMGFNVGVEVQTGGTFGIIQLPIRFFTTTLPHMVVLNANFLTIPELQYLAIFWFAAGIALLVTLAIVIAPIAIAFISGLLGLIRR